MLIILFPLGKRFMLDAFSRVVSEADSRGLFVTHEQLERLKRVVAEGEARIDIVNRITKNPTAIVTTAARDLFSEQPQLVTPGGSAYTSRRMVACLRDMEIILRYVTYAMFVGDASILEDRCLNGLRETYNALGVPGHSVASSIQKMKEVTLRLLIEPQIKENPQDLALSAIRKLYPKQWVTVEVTEFRNGFPARGQVLFYDSDISRLSSKISKLRGEIYTFFTSRIDDKPDPKFQGEVYKKNKEFIPIFSSLSSDYSSLVSELSSYFDMAAAAVG